MACGNSIAELLSMQMGLYLDVREALKQVLEARKGPK